MKKAFTLIELLVVVLIIGILSAIALPQYQKAVHKARIAEIPIRLKTIQQVADSFLLADHTLASQNDLLNVYPELLAGFSSVPYEEGDPDGPGYISTELLAKGNIVAAWANLPIPWHCDSSRNCWMEFQYRPHGVSSTTDIIYIQSKRDAATGKWTTTCTGDTGKFKGLCSIFN